MKKFAIGVDLGGTKILAALVSDNGTLLDVLRIPTKSSLGYERVIENMTGAIEMLSAKHPRISISSIGIGVAGQVEKSTGIVIHAPNLEWTNIHLKDLVVKKFGMPVVICNDVRAAAWGEWLSGAGMGCNDLVCVFVGTGIGGAIVCNGLMVDGHNNTAGEIGHIIAKMDGPTCTCGNRGCVEAIAGGWAIQRDAQQCVQNDTAGGKILLELAKGNIGTITAKTVVAAALAGDPMANGLMDNVVNVLVAAVTTIVNTIGPKLIIMGGGIIEGMPALVTRIENGIKANALHAATSQVVVTPARLHNNAGAIGAALFALKYNKEHKQQL